MAEVELKAVKRGRAYQCLDCEIVPYIRECAWSPTNINITFPWTKFRFTVPYAIS